MLDAALAVIDAGGVAALSMRTVGRRLGVDAKSLYNHVTGKDDLLDAVAEHVLAGLRLPAPTGSTAADLRAIAHEFRRATLAHPEAATLVLTRPMASFAGLAPVEAVLSVLRSAGCAPAEAVHLLRSLLAAMIGTLLREAGPAFGSGRRQELEAAGLPIVVEAAPHLARCDHDEEFTFTVELLVQAVLARVGT